MSLRMVTRLSKAERRGGGERTSSARIRGKRRADGRKTMWMRVIMFVELRFRCLAAKSWDSERTRTNSRTCLSARHGARLDVLLLLSWRRHWIPKRSNVPTQRYSGSRTRDGSLLCWISNEVTHTFPIISKCSCLLKSIAFPLENHLNLGFRDESLETSQGRTRLCPVVTSKLRGGTVILVGSTLKNRKKE